MQSSQVELVIYRDQFSVNCLSAVLTFMKVGFTITSVRDEREFKIVLSRMEETIKGSPSGCCIRECMMLPALIDPTNKSVVCGPEAIMYYVVEKLAMRPEFFGSSVVEKVQLLEVMTIIKDVYFTFTKAGLTSISRENMEILIRNLVDTRLARISNILKDGRTTLLKTKGYTAVDLALFDLIYFIEKVVPRVTSSYPTLTKFTDHFLKAQTESFTKFLTSPAFMKNIDLHSPDVSTYIWGLESAPTKYY